MSSSVEQTQYQEAREMAQTLHHDLISLAASLEGRLTLSEEKTLANLFQTQINLQTLVDEISPKPESPPTVDNMDNIAYAQTLRYAQDLVKAMRQQKEHQRRLEFTSQQLIRAEKLATVGQIAATVAHELNNILTPLLMYAKLIHQETARGDKSEVAEFAVQITTIAHRASDMLRQLVDASRSETPITIPIDLTKVLGNALNLLAPRINSQNIQIEQSYPHNIPLITANPGQLEQVFINIIINALDAMAQGGKFTVTVDLGNNLAEPDYLNVRLSDTGEGIPPENIGKLFEPFFTTKARGAGAGLGLFVSYLIVNQHNGNIEVESQPGIGTTFIIKFPVMDKDEA